MEQAENITGQERIENPERNSASGSGAGSRKTYTKMELDGKMHGEPAKKGTMFDRWAAKSAGREQSPGKIPESLHVLLFQRIGKRSIHRHFRSRDRMQSPRGNKRDSASQNQSRVSGTAKKPETGEKRAGADSQGNPTERFSGKGKRNRRTGGK